MKLILSLALFSLLAACGSDSAETEVGDTSLLDSALDSELAQDVVEDAAEEVGDTPDEPTPNLPTPPATEEDITEEETAAEEEAVEEETASDEEAAEEETATDEEAVEEETATEEEAVEISTQSFQDFYTGANWYLTDFDLPAEYTRSDYMNADGKILFDIMWTKRTRNLMADRLGYSREEMTKEFASEICAPKVEVGKASVYGVGDSSNMIAELDTDLSHCNIHGNEPANIRLRSFIPTKVGYKYQVTAQYQMRDYNMPQNAYRHFVMRFGGTAEHFDPVFNGFTEASINIVATHKYSGLVLRDNGLPDSYGILVDDITVNELGKVDNYDSCATLFTENSKGFRKCISGEVDTNQSCSMDLMTATKYVPGAGVTEERSNLLNAFVDEPAVQGSINFLSLGLKGRLKLACYIDGYAATYPIFNKQISLREISWGNVTPDNYPEQARIRVQLTSCDNDELNGNNHLGLVSTSETFSYDFTENSDGLSYSGCQLKNAMIIDKTPASSPSVDGFDLNSVNIKDVIIL